VAKSLCSNHCKRPRKSHNSFSDNERLPVIGDAEVAMEDQQLKDQLGMLVERLKV
jgi:hypothetical protein